MLVRPVVGALASGQTVHLLAQIQAQPSNFADWANLVLNLGVAGFLIWLLLTRRVISPSEQKLLVDTLKESFANERAAYESRLKSEIDGREKSEARAERVSTEKDRVTAQFHDRVLPVLVTGNDLVQQTTLLLHDAMRDLERYRREDNGPGKG